MNGKLLKIIFKAEIPAVHRNAGISLSVNIKREADCKNAEAFFILNLYFVSQIYNFNIFPARVIYAISRSAAIVSKPSAPPAAKLQ